MSLNIHTELHQAAYAAADQPQTVYALVGLTPGSVAGRMPLDLRLVLDRSTSMQEPTGGDPNGSTGLGTKLEMLKAAVCGVIDLLQDGDRLTIISFNQAHKVDLEPTLIQGQDTRDEAKRLVRKLKASGSTKMNLACRQAVAYPLLPDRINRVLLFTDGNNTCCDVDTAEQESRDAAALHRGEMPWVVLGTGIDYNEDFLTSLARASGGRELHVSDMAQAAQVFREELAVMGDVVVTGLVMNAQPENGARLVRVSRVVPDILALPLATPDFVSADLGDVDRARGQKVLLELEAPPLAEGTHILARLRFSYHVPLRKLLNQTAEVLVSAIFTRDASRLQVDQQVLNTVHLAGASQLYTMGVQAAAQGDVAGATRTLTTVAKIYTKLGQADLGNQVHTLTNTLLQQGQLTGTAEEIKRTLSTVTRHTVLRQPPPNGTTP